MKESVFGEKETENLNAEYKKLKCSPFVRQCGIIEIYQ